jgi:cytochrome P450
MPSDPDPSLSLYRLLEPDVLADPYPLYHRLRTEDPVHWDPFLHAWVVTRHADALSVLHRLSAACTPTPEQLASMGLAHLTPLAAMLVRQMLFMDAPAHTRLRSLAAQGFTPRRVAGLRDRVQSVMDDLVDRVAPAGRMDVIADIAAPFPAIVTAEMLGVPSSDHGQLKAWSADFAGILGIAQHAPERAVRALRAAEEMSAYFRSALRAQTTTAREGLVHAFVAAEERGDRLSEEEIVANCIITMVGGQETMTNLIGNGLLALLRHPDELARLRGDPGLVASAVEELLRFESPTQHTTRVAPDDVLLGGRTIRAQQSVVVVLGAANRDPERFPDPDRLDLARGDNRHLAFGWAAHFCFGAPLARIEGQVAFDTMVRRLPGLRMDPHPLRWRPHLALRGLTALPVRFGERADAAGAETAAAA